MAKNNTLNAEEQRDLIEFLAEFTHDPVGFIYAAFPWGEGELKTQTGPDDWQIQVLTEIRDGLKKIDDVIREAVASGHGIGKSALVAWLILWSISTFEDTRGVITANTDTQLKSKTWAELAKWYRLFIGRDLFIYTATSLFSADTEHQKTWRIDAIPWSDSNPEAFAGLHNQGKRILVIFDEASAISDKIWEVTEGALTDSNTEIIWCSFGNPTRNTGRFHDCFFRYRNLWKCKQIDSRTAKIGNKKQLQQWVDTYGEDSDFVKVRVRGMFPSASAKQFISISTVDAAYGKFLRPEQYNFAPVILALDPAWEGDDEIALVKRQGLQSWVLRTMPKNDNDVLVANILAQYEDSEKADAVFIDGGYGTGIVSVGRTMGRNWRLVWFGSESATPGCLNKRAEMWYLMKECLKEGGAIPQDNVLYNDLISMETVPRVDGVIQLMSKKDMKALGLPSPNRADALALTFAFPVVKKHSAGKSLTTNSNYNRFARR